MRFAAIDIGSNAVRLLVKEAVPFDHEVYFKKIELVRIPVRLGEDVFLTGKISDRKTEKLVKTMKAFKYLMETMDVDIHRSFATSAMREAKNGDEVISLIKEKTHVNIEKISGEEEARIIFSNSFVQNLDDAKSYLYIDVGGGSTELTLLRGRKPVGMASFKIGTVRLLQNKVKAAEWERLKNWVTNLTNSEEEIIGIGTGGNINRIYKEVASNFNSTVTAKQINEVVTYIGSFSYEDRIRKLKLKPDRADVIIPSGEIFSTVLETGLIKEMIIPKVGLSDGMIYQMYLNRKI